MQKQLFTKNTCATILSKSRLIQIMDIAKKESKHVVISILLPGAPDLEHIVITPINLDYKKSYYETAYNNEMQLITNTNVKIVGAIAIDLNTDTIC